MMTTQTHTVPAVQRTMTAMMTMNQLSDVND